MQFTPDELSILKQAAEIILRSQAAKPTRYQQQIDQYQPPPALPGLSRYDKMRLGLDPDAAPGGINMCPDALFR